MSAKNDQTDTFYPKNREQWRKWLQKHHLKKESIWLIQYKKTSGKSSIAWAEAVEEALCFGWVDSKRVGIDDEKFMQFFCKRKAKSTWSKINKLKVDQLIQQGLMAEAGLKSVEIARQNGSWTILDAVEELQIPEDLEKAFKKKPSAKKNFLSLSKSVQKAWLHRLHFAKRPETRQKRIDEIIQLPAKKK